MTPSTPLVLFDCDGTLVDGQAAIVEAMGMTFAGLGLAAPDPAKVRAIVGLSVESGLQRLLPEDSGIGVLDAAQRYRAAFRQLRQEGRVEDPLYPGIAQMLDRLDAVGALLGIVTGRGRRGLDAVLAAHGFAGRFVVTRTADDGPGKPDPTIVRDALAMTGVAASDAVVVGDTVFDVEMARAAGTRAIGVVWGYHEPESLLRAGASAIAQTPQEVPEAVARLMEG